MSDPCPICNWEATQANGSGTFCSPQCQQAWRTFLETHPSIAPFRDKWQHFDGTEKRLPFSEAPSSELWRYAHDPCATCGHDLEKHGLWIGCPDEGCYICTCPSFAQEMTNHGD